MRCFELINSIGVRPCPTLWTIIQWRHWWDGRSWGAMIIMLDMGQSFTACQATSFTACQGTSFTNLIDRPEQLGSRGLSDTPNSNCVCICNSLTPAAKTSPNISFFFLSTRSLSPVKENLSWKTCRCRTGTPLENLRLFFSWRVTYFEK